MKRNHSHDGSGWCCFFLVCHGFTMDLPSRKNPVMLAAIYIYIPAPYMDPENGIRKMGYGKMMMKHEFCKGLPG